MDTYLSQESNSCGPKHASTFHDPIHGVFTLGALSVAVMDTAPFQRLRYVKQLAATEYVFPGASHRRFEHSLGVAHLAAKWARTLKQKSPQLEVSDADIAMVELAGLCHDLGHGIFSHTFERRLVPELMRRHHVSHKWCHEEMSSRVLDHIVDSNSIDLSSYRLADGSLQTVKAYMSGCREGHSSNIFLFDIVNNQRNSVDVDKFDYLQRDAACTGASISCDFSRLMECSRVVGDEICFRSSEYMQLYKLFHDRASMFAGVYTHPTATAVEHMVVDALLEAEPVLNIYDRIHDVESFLTLDDGILRTVEALAPHATQHPAAVEKAQGLLRRLRKRDLYAFCGELTVPEDMVDTLTMPSSQDVAEHQSHNENCRLVAADIIVCSNKVDFTMGDRNPLDVTHFYNDDNDNERRLISHQRVSSMMPRAFRDVKFRVYSRRSDAAAVRAVKAAFSNWASQRLRLPSSALCSSTDRSATAGSQHTPVPQQKRARLAEEHSPGGGRTNRSLGSVLGQVDL